MSRYLRLYAYVTGRVLLFRYDYGGNRSSTLCFLGTRSITGNSHGERWESDSLGSIKTTPTQLPTLSFGKDDFNRNVTVFVFPIHNEVRKGFLHSRYYQDINLLLFFL